MKPGGECTTKRDTICEDLCDLGTWSPTGYNVPGDECRPCTDCGEAPVLKACTREADTRNIKSIIRDAHVKTSLRGAPEGFLRTNMFFYFLRHMILKPDLPFDSFRYMLSLHNFLDPQKFLRGYKILQFLLVLLFFVVSIFPHITNSHMF